MRNRLVILIGVAIILIAGVYWYIKRPFEMPPLPKPALPGRVARPRAPTPPPRPAMPPEPQPQVATPPVTPSTPAPEQQQPVAPPKMEPPKVAVPQEEPSKEEAPTPEPPKAEAPKVEVPPAVPLQAPPKVAERAETRPEAPPATARVPTVKRERRYSVQVATLVLGRNVRSLKKRLEKLGYGPAVQKTTAPITVHRVYADHLTSQDEALQVAQSLSGDGFYLVLVEMGSGQFALEVGSFFNQNEAIDLAHSLQKKNYSSKIVSTTAPTPVHVVRVGAYATRSEALRVLNALRGKGYEPILAQR